MAFYDTKPVDMTLTTDGSAKDAGDVVGGLITIPVSAHGQFTSGVLRKICITDGDAQAAALTIYFFDSAPTAIVDDAAFTLDAANIAKIIDDVSIATGDWKTIGSAKWVNKKGSDVDVDFACADGNLYAYVVCTATPTYSASGPTLRFFFQRD